MSTAPNLKQKGSNVALQINTSHLSQMHRCAWNCSFLWACFSGLSTQLVEVAGRGQKTGRPREDGRLWLQTAPEHTTSLSLCLFLYFCVKFFIPCCNNQNLFIQNVLNTWLLRSSSPQPSKITNSLHERQFGGNYHHVAGTTLRLQTHPNLSYSHPNIRSPWLLPRTERRARPWISSS